jgi:surface antigen
MANATAQGYQVDRTPAAGSILATNESRYGHVAYIESTDGNNITISEWNYAGRYKTTTRILSANDPRIVGVIHLN